VIALHRHHSNSEKGPAHVGPFSCKIMSSDQINSKIMSQLLESIIKESATKLTYYLGIHKGRPEVSFHDHIRQRRKDKSAHASSFNLIYLDTLAWKCLADYRQKKPKLTTAMKAFGESIERAIKTKIFAFPIGVPTYLELDSMTAPSTQETLKILVDELSQGLCIKSFHERIGIELQMLRTNKIEEAEELQDFLCSPVEMMGIPYISPPKVLTSQISEITLNKALFDTLYDLPFSIQLEVASKAPGEKWDNSRNTSNLNSDKAQHQSEVQNLSIGIFLELKGGIEAWFINEGLTPNPQEVLLYALTAMNYWKNVPSSRALPTMRILSSLYGLMRFDPNRRYKDGDSNDFLVAASALPVANALFTDRKFSNLLSDKRVGLQSFSNCVVVSGFEEMSQYLEERMQ
jgi:hypothetical protein